MKMRHVGLAAAILGIGVLILGWKMLGGAESSTPGDRSAETAAVSVEPTAAPADAAVHERGARRSQTTRRVDLPSGDTPLPQLVVLLKPRADAGDRVAACRLGVELLRCRSNDDFIEFSRRHLAGNVREAEERGQLGTANLMDEQQLRRLELQTQCRSLTDAQRAQGADYLIQAARAGEPEAMLRYATGEHWGMNMDDFLADDRFDAWRRESPAMLQRAFDAGDPRAPFALMAAYFDDFSPYTGLVANDPARGLAHRILYFRLLGRPDPPFRQVDATQLAQANALATAWHRDHFANRRVPDSRDAFLIPLFSAGIDGEDPAFCQPRGG